LKEETRPSTLRRSKDSSSSLSNTSSSPSNTNNSSSPSNISSSSNHSNTSSSNLSIINNSSSSSKVQESGLFLFRLKDAHHQLHQLPGNYPRCKYEFLQPLPTPRPLYFTPHVHILYLSLYTFCNFVFCGTSLNVLHGDLICILSSKSTFGVL
jgi:hypothetical protein